MSSGVSYQFYSNETFHFQRKLRFSSLFVCYDVYIVDIVVTPMSTMLSQNGVCIVDIGVIFFIKGRLLRNVENCESIFTLRDMHSFNIFRKYKDHNIQ